MDTRWTGVGLAALFQGLDVDPKAMFLTAFDVRGAAYVQRSVRMS